jgi:hypothetical protein
VKWTGPQWSGKQVDMKKFLPVDKQHYTKALQKVVKILKFGHWAH